MRVPECVKNTCRHFVDCNYLPACRQLQEHDEKFLILIQMSIPSILQQ